MGPPFIGTLRYGILGLVLLAGFAAVFARLVQLQVVDNDPLAREAQASREGFERLPGARGPIVDGYGNLLATTRTVVEVGVDPQALVREDFARVPELAGLLGLSEAEVREAFARRGTRWVKLADALSPEDYDRIRALGIRGVYGNFENRRLYPAGSLAAHVVGFVNAQGVADIGVERSMDFYLQGQDGWRESERDGRRRELTQFRWREVAPRRGLGVELTLDLFLQAAVERELDRVVEEYRPKSASVLVSDPRTGEVLALANRPTFDLNHYNEAGRAIPNRALSNVYEPGSTFKMVTAASALEAGVVEPSSEFDCGIGRVRYNGRLVSLPSDYKTFGVLSVEEILVKSSNRGAAWMGMRLGPERLHESAERFGFGERTGLRLGPESRGILHPPEEWDGLTISRLPMGHAVSATPAQVHRATLVLASGGWLRPLRIVRRVFDEEGETVVDFEAGSSARVLSGEVADRVNRLLERVASREGTARRAEVPGYRAAGKTGTTQMIVEGSYSRENHVASFTGFLPANDPQVVITVVIEDPQVAGVGSGGRVAAPVFRAIAESAIHQLQISPPPPPAEPDLPLAYQTPAS
jgi:cell division protein FtsI/penicillin-binding protein 2